MRRCMRMRSVQEAHGTDVVSSDGLVSTGSRYPFIIYAPDFLFLTIT
jgi:hypothetical protein